MLQVEKDYRSSRSQMFFKIGILKNFTIFTGKQLCWRDSNTGMFSCEYCEFFKNRFFYRTLPVAAFEFTQLSN